MDLQPRHVPHLMIIIMTMIGTVYFLHKSDQAKLRKSAAIVGESSLTLEQKSEKKKCTNREDGYRCYSKKDASK